MCARYIPQRPPQLTTVCRDAVGKGAIQACSLLCADVARTDCSHIQNNAEIEKGATRQCIRYAGQLPRPLIENTCRESFITGAKGGCDLIATTRVREIAERERIEADAFARDYAARHPTLPTTEVPRAPSDGRDIAAAASPSVAATAPPDVAAAVVAAAAVEEILAPVAVAESASNSTIMLLSGQQHVAQPMLGTALVPVVSASNANARTNTYTEVKSSQPTTYVSGIALAIGNANFSVGVTPELSSGTLSSDTLQHQWSTSICMQAFEIGSIEIVLGERVVDGDAGTGGNNSLPEGAATSRVRIKSRSEGTLGVHTFGNASVSRTCPSPLLSCVVYSNSHAQMHSYPNDIVLTLDDTYTYTYVYAYAYTNSNSYERSFPNSLDLMEWRAIADPAPVVYLSSAYDGNVGVEQTRAIGATFKAAHAAAINSSTRDARSKLIKRATAAEIVPSVSLNNHLQLHVCSYRSPFKFPEAVARENTSQSISIRARLPRSNSRKIMSDTIAIVGRGYAHCEQHMQADTYGSDFITEPLSLAARVVVSGNRSMSKSEAYCVNVAPFKISC